ncbi:MAG: ArnT family glycosyltransferase [bacterium]
MTEGKIPYRDLWDHKPPLIFYINALGLTISNGSMWGIFLLEFISLCLTAALGFILMKQVFGTAPACLGSLAWLVSLPAIFEFGNLNEEYALLFQFMGLYLFWKAEEKNSYSWGGFFLGMIGAVSFFLKQTLIGLWLAIGLYIAFSRIFSHRWRNLFTQLGTVFLGFASVTGVIIAYFASHQALAHFWDAVFQYNFLYASPSWSDRLRVTISGISRFSRTGLSVMALISLFLGIRYVLGKDILKRDIIGNPYGQRVLLLVAMVNLPIEFYLSSMAGNTYGHYYISWIPCLAILSGFFFSHLPLPVSSSPRMSLCLNTSLWPKIFIGLFIIVMCVKPFRTLRKQIKSSIETRKDSSYTQLIQLVKNNTSSSDYVLVWGAEGSINYLARRRSPSRFFYQYPLITRGYRNDQRLQEFLGHIQKRPPKLIIDVRNKLIPPIDSFERQKWITGEPYRLTQIYTASSPMINRVLDFMALHYQPLEKLGPYIVYRSILR